jgi:hypothetical protein
LQQKRFPTPPGRVFCTLCGAEIGEGGDYWQISGHLVCPACLPEFARRDYLSCRQVRGEEAAQ